MKYAALLAATAALSLAACSENETPAPEAIASEGEAAPVAEGAVKLSAGAAPTKQYIVGKWSEGEGCELAMTFNADGTITDGPADKWTLEGNTLSLGGLFDMQVAIVDDNTMESVNDGGGKATLKRCG